MSVTLEDRSLKDITLESLPRLQRLRELHFSTKPEVCLELARLMTRYWRGPDVPKSPDLRAGRMYHYVLEHKAALFRDENLLAGTTSSKRIGAIVYPDLGGMSVWPELETISSRPKNQNGIRPEEIKELNFDIFPFWIDKTIYERARALYHNPKYMWLFEKSFFYIVSKVHCISHTLPNYGALLKRGLRAFINDAQDREQGLGNSDGDRKKRDFYQGVQSALNGILTYADNLSKEAARQAGDEPDPDTRRELLEMSRICGRVPAHPAKTFREAVNSIWIYKVALHQESTNFAMSPGRLDQVLYPVFERELTKRRERGGEAGAQAFLKEAVELVGCLWLKICDHVPLQPEATEALFGGTGCNQAVTLGGVTPQGKDAVNDLTYVMLRATELLKLRDPNVNARYCPGVNSKQYLERLCQVNMSTGATPCFHSDLAAIAALKGQGVATRHARDYAAVGCVEPSSQGRTFGATGAILMNLPAVLEMALFQGKHRLTEGKQVGELTQAPTTMSRFEEFKEAFQTHLTWLIGEATAMNNGLGLVWQEQHPFPMLSALLEGCLKKGRDAVRGGATYNSTGAAIIGLAEVVDSLTAIEEFVFRPPQAVSFEYLLEAIKNNWQGYEKLQKRAQTSKEKFGTDSPMAKGNARWLMALLHQTFQSQPHYRGGRYTVGYWTMTNHAGFGAISGALPSGRSAGEPFPSGITPVSGTAPDLLTCLRFVADLDHTKIANGQALNLKYSPATTTAPKFAQTIEGYFQKGGLQVQFNTIDRLTLEEARQHPEWHPDLFVRVSGYSAYFKDLNPRMQEEIITRAEYDLDTKRQVL